MTKATALHAPTDPKTAGARSIDEMPVEALRERVGQARALLAQILALFPGLVMLTEADRRDSDGRVRGDDERDALSAVLDAVDERPEVFACLADKDHGVDDGRVETELLRERLERQECRSDLGDVLAPLTQAVEDTALVQGERCKPVILAAYQIARPVAKHDPALRTKLAPAVDYYSAIARKGARTRAASKAKPANDG